MIGKKQKENLIANFGDEFTYFFNLISKYVLPGILNVSTGKNNGNDLIKFIRVFICPNIKHIF